uniref:Methionine aminopeptidase n=1 Tax=Compsopogon caeruleus TaxID=31354 RepID=A0A7S1XFD4_9RHOD|mmetsp:Transcript_2731/g.4953  ORF Transcript_2731/g.4953 Transcript_2731/m.4953 type:complete len:381 (+) Transcript_2731:712-1854(+)
MSLVNQICSSVGCEKEATLRCPTCITLCLPAEESYFCGQECFRNSWKLHKQQHTSEAAMARLQKIDEQERRRLAFDNFKYTGALRAGNVSPMRTVPERIQYPDYARTGTSPSEERGRRAGQIIQLNAEEIDGMRKVCRLAREVLDIASRTIRPGVTTEEIDIVVHQACLERNAYPSPLNYYGFPKSCCTSVNEVICHGIPDDRPLQDGDIVNIDVTLYHGGFHGDLNETFLVGDSVDDSSKALIRSAYDCLMAGIGIVRPGTLIREIGAEVERIAKANKHSVVRSYCGHGIHRLFHCAPNVPHYKKNKSVGICKPGQIFTIEPMINAGGSQDETWPDKWTSVTVDGKRSAQFEHTLLVTDDGVEILTAKLPDSPKFFWEE